MVKKIKIQNYGNFTERRLHWENDFATASSTSLTPQQPLCCHSFSPASSFSFPSSLPLWSMLTGIPHVSIQPAMCLRSKLETLFLEQHNYYISTNQSCIGSKNSIAKNCIVKDGRLLKDNANCNKYLIANSALLVYSMKHNFICNALKLSMEYHFQTSWRVHFEQQ